jgi:hypothetical protein
LDDKLYYLWAKRDGSSTDSGPECVLLAETGTVVIDINQARRIFGHCDEARARTYAKQYDWELTGDLRPCEARIQAKAKAKAVAKITTTRDDTIGERFLWTFSVHMRQAPGKQVLGRRCGRQLTTQMESFFTQQE